MIRDDYREFLELALLYSGGNTVNGITMKSPGPVNRARFMQKAIYILKMALFSNQIDINNNKKIVIEDIAGFLITCYIKRWMQSTNILYAAYDDFSFLEDIKKYIIFK